MIPNRAIELQILQPLETGAIARPTRTMRDASPAASAFELSLQLVLVPSSIAEGTCFRSGTSILVPLRKYASLERPERNLHTTISGVAS